MVVIVESTDKKFLKPILNAKNADVYIARKAILQSLMDNIGFFKGHLLDVGCGRMPYKPLLTSSQSKVVEYIGLDFKNNKHYTDSAPDITWDGGKIPLADQSVDCAIMTEVLEHCPNPENVMNEVYRVLKPNGILFITVPFFWPLHDVPYDQYRYTPFSLERHLTNSGFRQIDIKVMGGWDASFAQMIGLWVNRRPLPYLIKRICQIIAIPIMSVLLKNDTMPTDYAGSMATGFSGVARKIV